jgi:hypothetical protein
MLYLKSCPRCKTGTVQLGSDVYGSYLSCLNCGFEKSSASVRKLDYEETRRESELTAVGVAAVANEHQVPVDDELVGKDELAEDDFNAGEEELIELERAVG